MVSRPKVRLQGFASIMDFASLFDTSLAIAAAGGLVGAIIRGFTGFGTNLVWAPVLVLVYGPIIINKRCLVKNLNEFLENQGKKNQ